MTSTKDAVAADQLLSIVVPAFNEAESLETLHRELVDALVKCGRQFEIVFVDDGSTDGSWTVLQKLAVSDERVRALRFRGNFGKAAALAAGFAAARGAVIFTLDADLQDDPAEMPKFLAKLEQGFDLVSGWKKSRKDPWHKTKPSWLFNRTVSWLTGVHLKDHNCGFKCYRRETIEEIQLYGEFHRFTPVLAAARGFRIGEVAVHHRPRQFGASKYGWRRFSRGLLDLLTVKFLTSYRNRPQHLLGGLGLLGMLVGSCGLAYLAIVWWFEPIGGRPMLVFSATTLMVGVQFLAVGLLAELILARSQTHGHIYSVAESIGGSGDGK